MKPFRWPIFFITVAACSLISCQAAKNVPVAHIYSSLHCRFHDAGIYAVTGQTKLQAIFNKIHANSIGASVQKTPDINFNTHQIFLLSLGTKPTSGHGLLLEEGPALYQNNILVLPVKVMEPAENTMQAQVITTPCVLVSVPKNNYRKVMLSGNKNLAQRDMK